jgi:putative transcriptional regulator
MITHHPKHELLSAFVEGELPASLSAAIAVHAELCEICANNIKHLTDESAANTFSADSSIYNAYSDKKVSDKPTNIDASYALMIDAITDDESISETTQQDPLEIEINCSTYQLPTALRSMPMTGWQKMGKLSRSRLHLNEGSLHSSLLHIEKNGGVPSHTHKGFELTLLLEGSFQDELGTYVKGDFIWLTNKNTHTPHTTEGCLCYTVADDALQFTQGFSKLLNPIGAFIY